MTDSLPSNTQMPVINILLNGSGYKPNPSIKRGAALTRSAPYVKR